MIKNILTYPQDKEILTQRSQEIIMITDEIKTLIQDLKDTLHNTDTGCGISAVQIGELKRICVIKYNGKDYVLINPIITKTRGTRIFKEGCLSAPGIYVNVERAQKVWCTYMDENGDSKELEQGGLMSIIIQHELDHFEGWCEVFNPLKTEE
jgi:peptide deformylase